MPRMRRVILPGYAHHILQRGHNKQAVFKGSEGYIKFMDDMRELKEDFGVRLYAWSMLANRVHLLLDPGNEPEMLAAFMKAISSRTTHYRNRLESRSGTLWESRYRSSPVHPGWVLACIRHIERVPLEERLIDHLDEYPWSSYKVHAGLADWGWLDAGAAWLALGGTPFQRYQQYREYMGEPPNEEEERILRNAVRRNQLTGGADFANEVEALTGMRVPYRGRGRPRKRNKKEM